MWLATSPWFAWNVANLSHINFSKWDAKFPELCAMEERLHSQIRPERSILKWSVVSKLSEINLVCMEDRTNQVHTFFFQVFFWSCPSSQNIYQINKNTSSSLNKINNSNIDLSGQFRECWLSQGRDFNSTRQCNTSFTAFRCSAKSRKTNFGTNSSNTIYKFREYDIFSQEMDF